MTEPTKTRPGDQPLPNGGRECVQDALIALIEERKQLGIERYGSPLMTHNGRDAVRDATEEALDLTVYLMQVAMEMRDLRAAVERAENLRDKWLAWPADDMHHGAGLMLAKYLSGEAYGSDEPRPEPLPSIHAGDVQGFCPACTHPTLYIGEGGHLTCSLIDCPKTEAADELLHGVPAPVSGPAATQATEADDPELTAAEARDLADELSTDLYRAQDALWFVGECCDIADREQRPITTVDVREWLKGARCGRQLAADDRPLYDKIAGMFSGPLPWPATDPHCSGTEGVCGAHGFRRHEPAPTRLREQYATAIEQAVYEYRERACQWDETDGSTQEIGRRATRAVLTIRDREMEQLRRDRDLAIAHDRQPYPTADAYEKACEALHKHRERADNAEARIRLAREALIRDGYFTTDEVGDDIAPRIIELSTARLEVARKVIRERDAAEERGEQLAATLREVLDAKHNTTDQDVACWRTVLNPPKER